MKEIFRKAVENKNAQSLLLCLSVEQKANLDSDQYDSFEQALKGTWHRQHEDLVNTIYLENLIDDRFVEPILDIALKKEIFRRYDDELESTLRKCVHALKTIDSDESNKALKALEELNNANVKITLEMYE